MDGIFQYHQAMILKEAGYRIGLLSVRLSFSLPMVLKGVFFKLLGKSVGNASDNYSIGSLLRLGANKLFWPQTFVEKETIDGLVVYRIDGLFFRPPKNNQNHLSWVKAGMVCFEEYVKHEGMPDLIHAHNAVYAGMLAGQIKKKFGRTYIITEHSSIYALKQVSAPVLKLVDKAYAEASGLYAVSETFAVFLDQQFPARRFAVLPNVLDQYLETSPLKQSKPHGKNFIFLHIAALLPVKDQRTLLNAFALVVKKNPAAELWMAGGGELLPKLQEQVSALHLQDSVRFLGVLNRQQVIDHLQACDCFVLSSLYETFGVVTIEAMLFGKPVITTRCGIGPSAVNEGVGFVVDVGDPQQMAAAMLRISETAHNYKPEYIRNRVIDAFGRESFLANIHPVYKKFASLSKPKEVAAMATP